MTDVLLFSSTTDVQFWNDAEPLGLKIGEKAARLLTLPREWCPPFVAIAASVIANVTAVDGHANNFFSEELLPIAQTLIAETGQLIVRSSVVGKSIWDRGTYESAVVQQSHDGDLADKLLAAINEVNRSANGSSCAIILQSHIVATETGEFGNLMRISRTRDHWEVSVRRRDPVVQIDRFNSQRDIAPDRSKPLLARPALQRERLFGSIGAWINNELLRGLRTRVNCEWVRVGDRFYIVQIDAEDDDLLGINPMQLFIEPSVISDPSSGKLLRDADKSSRSKWDKLAVLDELFDEHSSIVPSLKFVPLSELTAPDNGSNLLHDFSSLLQKNIVIRTSIAAGKEKITNLPKSDCLTASAAARWCVDNAAALTKQYPNVEMAFVAHRYIGSRASTWVRANPDDPVVEIHGTWGLPDALQFCPYDIWEVHVPTEEITEYTNYKSHVLLLQTDGSWKYERVKNDIARYQSLSRSDVLELAKRSFELAKKLNSPCHIMWFVGCVTSEQSTANIPWYWTKAHQTENPDRGSPQIFTVTQRADLCNVSLLKQKYRRLAVSLKPQTVELLRDNGFLAEVAAVVKPIAVPVLLSGSTLAHAFYQLRKSGCVVISDGDKDHQRTRRQASFGKLVRDKIPEKIASQQEQQSVATIPLSARTGFLVGKFIEEILEAREAEDPANRRAEFADVFEVFRAFIAAANEDLSEVVAEADRKKTNVGGFEDGRLLLTTSLPKAGEDLASRDNAISGQLLGALSPDQIFRLPFTFFGFSEIGQQRLLRFPKAEYDLQITLQRDCIELSLKRTPEQLKLDI